MAQLGFLIDKQAYSFEEALSYAETGTAPVPVEYLRALIGDQRDSDVPSPSTLDGCLRQWLLQRRVGYYEPLTAKQPAIFGTAMHEMLAKYASKTARTEVYREAWIETGLPAPYDRVLLGGTTDYEDEEYDGGAGVQRDYKSKLYIPPAGKEFYATDGHLRQVNVYHLLRVLNGERPLKYWEIFYFSSMHEPRYLRGELAPVGAVEKWVRKKLREWAIHQRDGTLPPPVPQFFEKGPRGKILAPCSYCPVREACVDAWKEEKAGREDTAFVAGASEEVPTGQ